MGDSHDEILDVEEAAELEAQAAAIRAKVATGGPIEEPDILTPEERAEWEEFRRRQLPPTPAARQAP